MKPRPVPLQRILDSSQVFNHLAQQAKQDVKLLQRVHAALPVDLVRHLPAARARSAVLVLYTHSPAWSSRLRYMTPRIRAELPEFREIRIRIIPGETQEFTSAGSKAPRLLKEETAAVIHAIASTVPDPELNQALKRLASHHDGKA